MHEQRKINRLDPVRAMPSLLRKAVHMPWISEQVRSEHGARRTCLADGVQRETYGKAYLVMAARMSTVLTVVLINDLLWLA